MLREYMAFDNQPFVDQLEHRGFTVLKESRPNYGQTLLSLASSLNFEFLDVARLSPGGATDLGVAVSMIKHNRVMRAFKAHGYVVATAPSGFQGTDPMPEADVAWGGRFSTLNEFERMSLGLTAGSALLAFTLGQETDTYEAHRATILSAFEHLRSSGARTDGTPRFAFVHIVAPHPPFVFDEAGALPPQDRPFARSDGPYFLGRRAEYQQRYAAQARFLNDSVIEAVDEIFAATGPDDHPIIILQGDHGPASHFDPYSGPDYLRERMAILNAWYVPPDLEVDLYDAITPVNTFRVVLNAVFDEQLPLMPDRSLFSTYYDPFEFTEVGEDGRPVR